MRWSVAARASREPSHENGVNLIQSSLSLSVAMKITHQPRVHRSIQSARFAAVLSSAFSVLFAASLVLPFDGTAYAATQEGTTTAVNTAQITLAPERHFAAPSTVSPEMAVTVNAPASDLWLKDPGSAQAVSALAKRYAEAAGPATVKIAQDYGVDVKAETLDGVPVFKLTPKKTDPEKAGKVVFYIHGGGYILGHGISGIGEGALLAGLHGWPVVAVDYRMAPEYPYPAAIDDAFRAYQALIKTVGAANVAVFGTSTGGAMTLILGIQAARAHVPMPAALIAGTPWADLGKVGDSYVTNEDVDNVLGTYDGLIKRAAEVYAGNANMRDPLLSPVYAEDETLSQFPPTLLLSGTRDLFLSNTVRMHERLLNADAPAELIVYEALSHAQYYLNPKAPETATHYKHLDNFLRKTLLESK